MKILCRFSHYKTFYELNSSDGSIIYLNEKFYLSEKRKQVIYNLRIGKFIC